MARSKSQRWIAQRQSQLFSDEGVLSLPGKDLLNPSCGATTWEQCAGGDGWKWVDGLTCVGWTPADLAEAEAPQVRSGWWTRADVAEVKASADLAAEGRKRKQEVALLQQALFAAHARAQGLQRDKDATEAKLAAEALSRENQELKQAAEAREQEVHKARMATEIVEKEKLETEKLLRNAESRADMLQRRLDASSMLNFTDTPQSVAATALARWSVCAESHRGFTSFKLAPLSEDTPEFKGLKELWDRGGPGGKANAHTLRRVEVAHADGLMQSLHRTIANYEIRRSSPGPFNTGLSPNPVAGAVRDPNGEKRAVLQRLRDRCVNLPGLQNASALLTFHGCTHAAADGICETGFADIRTLDAGFFGAGIYVTTHAQYAADYATGAFSGGPNPTDPVTGEHVVLAAWATPGLAYPITRGHDGDDCDYEPGTHHSKFFSSPGSAAKALRAGFKSHYVCISEAGGYQCMDGVRDGRTPDYDELVVGDEAQLVPAYRLYFS